MNVISAAIRQSDGLVASLQISRKFPADEGAALIQNAVNKFGGVANDWLALEIPTAVYGQIAYDGAKRQFATINSWQEQVDEETVTFYEVTALSQSTPPTMNQDKTQIANDGADTVTFTADVGNGSYSSLITWRVIQPDGQTSVETENMSGGVATLEYLTNGPEGSHTIQAETEVHGVAEFVLEVI